MLQKGNGMPEFNNGRKLRDYQETSFNWMVQHNLKGENCILGDEMGLGKTAQVLLLRQALPPLCCPGSRRPAVTGSLSSAVKSGGVHCLFASMALHRHHNGGRCRASQC
jgi:hypothetical protein